ncbi:hypothetical protein [Enterovibrio norvegicus]|uniref:DUF1963 domain-containing protein n=1 Tax=Enterovibrio norvegicus DSM 15893 TaxID=1121869 RepID=A0A1I5XV24_9GAMM|nr:hypothetical protein [Enterovibrio norvegicus]SFQ35736.1 hypothetical protein SAMN03084138_04846 [Enterovibrio norvegicus DSM 15893]
MNEFESYIRSLGSEAIKAVLLDNCTDEFSSRTGGTFYDIPGKSWPMGSSGPLRPLLQIVVNELPYIPKQISHLMGICIYIDKGYVTFDILSEEGGELVVREIPKGSTIHPLSNPTENKFEEKDIKWEKFIDYPSSSDFIEWLDNQNVDCDFESNEFEKALIKYSNYGFSKINGWPTTIQGPSYDEPNVDECTIQVSLDIDIPFGDSTIFKINWAAKINNWHCMWETC